MVSTPQCEQVIVYGESCVFRSKVFLTIVSSTCNMGRLECVENECSSTCSFVGYNHVITLDGHVYDFDASDSECDYSLVQVR